MEQFRLQSRDLYVPAGDIGMWQGALRNPDDPVRAAVAGAIGADQPITVELLYSDLVGHQRTISRFGLFPGGGTGHASLNRHWYLDWDGPRPESRTLAAAEAVIRDHDAAAHRRAAAEREPTMADPSGPPDADDDPSRTERAGPADG